MSTTAEVRLWGRRIAAVSLDEGRDVAAFQYDPDIARSRIEVAPLSMPLASRIYTVPSLPRISFHGLPGLLADSLPDKFGTALINAWHATPGRSPETFNAIEPLEANWEGERPRRFKSPRSGMSGGRRRSDSVRASDRATG